MEKRVSTVLSRAPAGLAAPLVRVEVHLGPGLPTFGLVGLPEAVVRESKERVRSALITAGFDFPAGRITVNLSPADLPKAGGRFDLPIAVGILAASGQLSRSTLARREFYGELALSGELRETPKLLPALMAGARTQSELIVPAANALEASWVASPRVRMATHLLEVCDALNGRLTLPTARPLAVPDQHPFPDLAEVRAQFGAKRALEIAAAGGHGLLISLTTGPTFQASSRIAVGRCRPANAERASCQLDITRAGSVNCRITPIVRVRSVSASDEGPVIGRSKAALGACREAAAKTKKERHCTIVMPPP